MKKFIEALSEYFMGTKTIEEHSGRTPFYREFTRSDEEFRDYQDRREERLGAFIKWGKEIPILIDAFAIGYALYTKTPPYLLALGEAMRIYNLDEGKRLKRADESYARILKINAEMNEFRDSQRRMADAAMDAAEKFDGYVNECRDFFRGILGVEGDDPDQSGLTDPSDTPPDNE